MSTLAFEYGTDEYFEERDNSWEEQKERLWNILINVVNDFNNSNDENTGFLVLKRKDSLWEEFDIFMYLFNGELMKSDPFYVILRDVYDNGDESRYLVFGLSGNIGKVFELETIENINSLVNSSEDTSDRIESCLQFIERQILPKEDDNEIQRDLEIIQSITLPTLLKMDPKWDIQIKSQVSNYEKEINMELLEQYGGIFISPKIRNEVRKYKWYSKYIKESPTTIIFDLSKFFINNELGEGTKFINIFENNNIPNFLVQYLSN